MNTTDVSDSSEIQDFRYYEIVELVLSTIGTAAMVPLLQFKYRRVKESPTLGYTAVFHLSYLLGPLIANLFLLYRDRNGLSGSQAQDVVGGISSGIIVLEVCLQYVVLFQFFVKKQQVNHVLLRVAVPCFLFLYNLFWVFEHCLFGTGPDHPAAYILPYPYDLLLMSLAINFRLHSSVYYLKLMILGLTAKPPRGAWDEEAHES